MDETMDDDADTLNFLQRNSLRSLWITVALGFFVLTGCSAFDRLGFITAREVEEPTEPVEDLVISMNEQALDFEEVRGVAGTYQLTEPLALIHTETELDFALNAAAGDSWDVDYHVVALAEDGTDITRQSDIDFGIDAGSNNILTLPLVAYADIAVTLTATNMAVQEAETGMQELSYVIIFTAMATPVLSELSVRYVDYEFTAVLAELEAVLELDAELKTYTVRLPTSFAGGELGIHPLALPPFSASLAETVIVAAETETAEFMATASGAGVTTEYRVLVTFVPLITLIRMDTQTPLSVTHTGNLQYNSELARVGDSDLAVELNAETDFANLYVTGVNYAITSVNSVGGYVDAHAGDSLLEGREFIRRTETTTLSISIVPGTGLLSLPGADPYALDVFVEVTLQVENASITAAASASEFRYTVVLTSERELRLQELSLSYNDGPLLFSATGAALAEPELGRQEQLLVGDGGALAYNLDGHGYTQAGDMVMDVLRTHTLDAATAEVMSGGYFELLTQPFAANDVVTIEVEAYTYNGVEAGGTTVQENAMGTAVPITTAAAGVSADAGTHIIEMATGEYRLYLGSYDFTAQDKYGHFRASSNADSPFELVSLTFAVTVTDGDDAARVSTYRVTVFLKTVAVPEVVELEWRYSDQERADVTKWMTANFFTTANYAAPDLTAAGIDDPLLVEHRYYQYKGVEAAEAGVAFTSSGSGSLELQASSVLGWDSGDTAEFIGVYTAAAVLLSNQRSALQTSPEYVAEAGKANIPITSQLLAGGTKVRLYVMMAERATLGDLSLVPLAGEGNVEVAAANMVIYEVVLNFVPAAVPTFNDFKLIYDAAGTFQFEENTAITVLTTFATAFPMASDGSIPLAATIPAAAQLMNKSGARINFNASLAEEYELVEQTVNGTNIAKTQVLAEGGENAEPIVIAEGVEHVNIELLIRERASIDNTRSYSIDLPLELLQVMTVGDLSGTVTFRADGGTATTTTALTELDAETLVLAAAFGTTLSERRGTLLHDISAATGRYVYVFDEGVVTANAYYDATAVTANTFTNLVQLVITAGAGYVVGETPLTTHIKDFLLLVTETELLQGVNIAELDGELVTLRVGFFDLLTPLLDSLSIRYYNYPLLGAADSAGSPLNFFARDTDTYSVTHVDYATGTDYDAYDITVGALVDADGVPLSEESIAGIHVEAAAADVITEVSPGVLRTITVTLSDGDLSDVHIYRSHRYTLNITLAARVTLEAFAAQLDTLIFEKKLTGGETERTPVPVEALPYTDTPLAASVTRTLTYTHSGFAFNGVSTLLVGPAALSETFVLSVDVDAATASYTAPIVQADGLHALNIGSTEAARSEVTAAFTLTERSLTGYSLPAGLVYKMLRVELKTELIPIGPPTDDALDESLRVQASQRFANPSTQYLLNGIRAQFNVTGFVNYDDHHARTSTITVTVPTGYAFSAVAAVASDELVVAVTYETSAPTAVFKVNDPVGSVALPPILIGSFTFTQLGLAAEETGFYDYDLLVSFDAPVALELSADDFTVVLAGSSPIVSGANLAYTVTGLTNRADETVTVTLAAGAQGSDFTLLSDVVLVQVMDTGSAVTASTQTLTLAQYGFLEVATSRQVTVLVTTALAAQAAVPVPQILSGTITILGSTETALAANDGWPLDTVYTLTGVTNRAGLAGSIRLPDLDNAHFSYAELDAEQELPLIDPDDTLNTATTLSELASFSISESAYPANHAQYNIVSSLLPQIVLPVPTLAIVYNTETSGGATQLSGGSVPDNAQRYTFSGVTNRETIAESERTVTLPVLEDYLEYVVPHSDDSTQTTIITAETMSSAYVRTLILPAGTNAQLAELLIFVLREQSYPDNAATYEIYGDFAMQASVPTPVFAATALSYAGSPTAVVAPLAAGTATFVITDLTNRSNQDATVIVGSLELPVLGDAAFDYDEGLSAGTLLTFLEPDGPAVTALTIAHHFTSFIVMEQLFPANRLSYAVTGTLSAQAAVEAPLLSAAAVSYTGTTLAADAIVREDNVYTLVGLTNREQSEAAEVGSVTLPQSAAGFEYAADTRTRTLVEPDGAGVAAISSNEILAQLFTFTVRESVYHTNAKDYTVRAEYYAQDLQPTFTIAAAHITYAGSTPEQVTLTGTTYNVSGLTNRDLSEAASRTILLPSLAANFEYAIAEQLIAGDADETLRLQSLADPAGVDMQNDVTLLSFRVQEHEYAVNGTAYSLSAETMAAQPLLPSPPTLSTATLSYTGTATEDITITTTPVSGVYTLSGITNRALSGSAAAMAGTLTLPALNAAGFDYVDGTSLALSDPDETGVGELSPAQELASFTIAETVFTANRAEYVIAGSFVAQRTLTPQATALELSAGAILTQTVTASGEYAITAYNLALNEVTTPTVQLATGLSVSGFSDITVTAYDTILQRSFTITEAIYPEHTATFTAKYEFLNSLPTIDSRTLVYTGTPNAQLAVTRDDTTFTITGITNRALSANNMPSLNLGTLNAQFEYALDGGNIIVAGDADEATRTQNFTDPDGIAATIGDQTLLSFDVRLVATAETITSYTVAGVFAAQGTFAPQVSAAVDNLNVVVGATQYDDEQRTISITIDNAAVGNTIRVTFTSATGSYLTGPGVVVTMLDITVTTEQLAAGEVAAVTLTVTEVEYSANALEYTLQLTRLSSLARGGQTSEDGSGGLKIGACAFEFTQLACDHACVVNFTFLNFNDHRLSAEVTIGTGQCLSNRATIFLPKNTSKGNECAWRAGADIPRTLGKPLRFRQYQRF